MSELELKGGIVQLVSKLKNGDSLRELKEIIELFVRNHANDTDYWDELDESERSQLEAAIKESEEEENLISHQSVMSKYKKWLEK